MDLKAFKDVKMFGTVLQICGYDLNLDDTKYNYENACCVEYHVNMFNKIKNKKWTVERFMKELNMTSIDEGVSLNQLIPLYIKYRIGFYVLDFKYNITESHNKYGYKVDHNYSRLFYLIDGNHLYPIVKKSEQHKISQIKDKTTNTFKVKTVEKCIKTPLMMEDIYNIHDVLLNNVNNILEENNIFIHVDHGLVHGLFYEALKKNKLYNKNVKVEHGRITQFDMDKITIQENPHYIDVRDTINKLNVSAGNAQYVYTGQSLQRLAQEYYNNNFKADFYSEMSPQVINVFDNDMSKNTGFNITFKDIEATHAYDFNKLYSSILKNSGKYGWCKFLSIDEIQPFDGKIRTGFYYIETNNCYPCRGNGWYCDEFLESILYFNIISIDDIKYQLKPSNVLKSDYFKQFVEDVGNVFSGYKLALNGFIGLLAQLYHTHYKTYFTQDRSQAVNAWLINPDEISISGIYDNNKDIHNYKFLDATNIHAIVDAALERKNEFQPIVWMVTRTKKNLLYNNACPIQRKIYDIANLMVYKCDRHIKSLNPRCELVRLKTDCLGYINIDVEPDTSSIEWGKIKIELPPKRGELIDYNKLTRTNTFILNNKNWDTHKREVLDDSDITSLLNTGGLVYGMAGTGKSTSLNNIKNKLDENSYIICAFTHKASEIVDGNTCHKVLGIDVKTHQYDSKLIKSYIKRGVKYICIDEISMVPSWIWNIFAHIKQQYGFIILGFGDWAQIRPVGEEHIEFENTDIVKRIFNYKLYELVKVWRFDENSLLQDAYNASAGGKLDFSNYNKEETPLSLCYTNNAVDALNEKWNKYYAETASESKEVIGYDNVKYLLYKGLKLIAYKTHGKYLFTNSQELSVESWDDEKMQLKNKHNKIIELELKYTASFKPAYAMTVHKSQGTTINVKYSIYEYKAMEPRMLYVALTRTTKKENVNFCDIDNYNAYTGYIYSYEVNGKYYIGSTRNLNKRKQEHRDGMKSGETKFNTAIKKYGFDKFNYKVLETLKYNNIKDLWRLEDQYIEQYNSINDGYNIRYNVEKTLL